MADAACLNDSAELLGTTTVSAVTLDGAVLVSDTTYSFDYTEYLNLKTMCEEIVDVNLTTSIGCGITDTGVSDLTTSACGISDTGVYQEYEYASNSYTTEQLATWEGMTPEQQNLVSPTYYINRDGTITEVT
jgi:hypothetical protein